MKRRTIIALAAGAALVVAGIGVAWIAVNGPPPPEEGAEQYLAALASGDLTRVEALLADDITLDELTEATFSGATSFITDYTFEVVPDSSGAIGVRADVSLAGEPGVVFFTLRNQGGQWRVGADFLGTLEASTTQGDSVFVSAELVAADTAIPVFPAVYPVKAAPADALSGGLEVPVTNDAPVEVQILAELTEAATARAQEALDEIAASCTAPAAAIPPACGFRIPWATELSSLDSVAFRIEQPLTVELDAEAAMFTATGGVVVATVTGTPREGAAASPTYRIDNWTLRGLYRFTGDEMKFDLG